MVDWPERAACIMLSIGILANALLVRRMVQAWFFPAVLFSIAWFVYTIVPLVCFPDAHVYPIAMFYILCATIAVSIGGVAKWRALFNNNHNVKMSSRNYYGSGILMAAFVASFAITVLCLLINSVTQGISIGQLVSNLNESAAEYAGRRYASDIAPNVYQQIGNVLAYFCAGLGGLIIIPHRNFYVKSFVFIAALFPAIFVMISQSARGMLFLCGAIFYGGILVSRLQHDQTSLLSKRAIPMVIAGLIVVIPLVTISFVARGVEMGAGQGLLEAIAPYWASYTSGHLFAFSDWFGSYVGEPAAQSYDDPGLTGGFYTFMAIFRIFGDDRPIPIGVYGEYLFIPPYIGTNIYTVFRGLIQDFGIFGSVTALTFLSYITHLAFRLMLSAAKPAFSAAAILFAISFIYQSFIISALMWTTLIVGLFVLGFVLRFFRGTQQIINIHDFERDHIGGSDRTS